MNGNIAFDGSFANEIVGAGSQSLSGENTRLPVDTRSVIARFESTVYRVALTHTRCQSDADDVFQDVFLTYHRKQPVSESEDHLKGWLIVATINCAKRVASSSWRTRVVPLSSEHVDSLPEVFSFKTNEQDAIFRALSELPDNYRTVLHLFYFEDLSISRIAEVLGLASGAVKMRLSRGREMMRSQLTGGLFDE